MSYKSILVQLDSCEAAQSRLELALRLAKHFDAHLTGFLTLFSVTHGSVYTITKSAKYIAQHQKRCAELSGVLKRLFETEAARMKVPGEWLFTSNEYGNVALRKQVRIMDLIVAGQRNPNDPESFVDEQFVENLVLSAGRPVLLVPYAGTFPTIGTRVLVAWDGSREATRAVHDALPILARAQQTTVVTVNALEGEGLASRLPGVDIAAQLERHGANVVTEDIEGVRGVSIGETLLSRAGDLGADLMVMGAYGHPRWREVVLGGATRSILKSMTVPVLMSS